MSVQSEITRLQNAKATIKAAIEGKGVTVPDGTLLDGMAALIENIEAGGGEKNLFGTYFETGSIIPASDITTDYTIQFQKNFSGIPDNLTTPYYTFVLWCSIPPGFTSVQIPKASWAWVYFGRRRQNFGMSFGQYLSASGSMDDATYNGVIGNDGVSKFTLNCTASKKLVAGYVYNWIAIAPSREGYAT